jgi:hypothetical protein
MFKKPNPSRSPKRGRKSRPMPKYFCEIINTAILRSQNSYSRNPSLVARCRRRYCRFEPWITELGTQGGDNGVPQAGLVCRGLRDALPRTQAVRESRGAASFSVTGWPRPAASAKGGGSEAAGCRAQTNSGQWLYGCTLGPVHFSPYGLVREPAKKPSCACSRTLIQEDGSGCFSH